MLPTVLSSPTKIHAAITQLISQSVALSPRWTSPRRSQEPHTALRTATKIHAAIMRLISQSVALSPPRTSPRLSQVPHTALSTATKIHAARTHLISQSVEMFQRWISPLHQMMWLWPNSFSTKSAITWNRLLMISPWLNSLRITTFQSRNSSIKQKTTSPWPNIWLRRTISLWPSSWRIFRAIWALPSSLPRKMATWQSQSTFSRPWMILPWLSILSRSWPTF